MKKIEFRKVAAEALAALATKVAPTWCVKKYLTFEARDKSGFKGKLANEVYERLTSAQELRAIDKLKLDETGLKARKWATDTEVELIKRGNYALKDRIGSYEEAKLDAVVTTGDETLIAEVFGRATPSIDYRKRFLRNTEMRLIISVARLKPSIFNELCMGDLIEALGNDANLTEFLTVLNEATDTKARNKWSKEIVGAGFRTPTNSKRYKLMQNALTTLLKSDINIADDLVWLRENYRDLYDEILKPTIEHSNHLVQYICTMLPKVSRFIDWNATEGTDDEMWWLELALERLRIASISMAVLDLAPIKAAKPAPLAEKVKEHLLKEITGYEPLIKARQVLPKDAWKAIDEKLVDEANDFSFNELKTIVELDNLDEKHLPTLYKKLAHKAESFEEIKEVIEKTSEKPYEKLINKIEEAWQATKALEVTPEMYHEKIRDLLIRKVTATDWQLLFSFWPFHGWSAVSAERAVREIARLRSDLISPEKIEQLEESLKKAYLDELEIVSEEDAISLMQQEQMDVIITHRLHPEGEIALFISNKDVSHKWAPAYVRNFRMSDEAFAKMVSVKTDYNMDGIYEQIANLIVLHANTWGFSERNYLDLLQSPHYNKLATVLKEVKPSKAENEAEAEDQPQPTTVVVEPEA